jgi:Fe-S-cluster-containing dehydrogenase component
MKKPHLIVDIALCQGCNNCFMACKDEHVGNDWPGYSRPQSNHGERWIDIPCNERGQYPLIDVAYRPTLCTHCADAPCVARSGGAISKRPDGLVLIDPVKAAGRRELVDSCPYGMIIWSEKSSTPQKCTLCAHLLDNGWTKPRCVQACGPGALSFVLEDDPEFATRVAAGGVETLHPGQAAQTAVCYQNLSLFDSCFIAGSVAFEQGGVVDCGAGALATLRKVGVPPVTTADPGLGDDAGSDAVLNATPLRTLIADAFGDFKFDGLEADSGEYEIGITLSGYAPVRVTAELGCSVTLSTIMLGGER